jgi:DNA-binding NarL/FixJ family response regulator
MVLTKRERTILQLAGQGLSDYKIGRKINTDPPSVTRSRKNAYKKLYGAMVDTEWAARNKVNFEIVNRASMLANRYSFFL